MTSIRRGRTTKDAGGGRESQRGGRSGSAARKGGSAVKKRGAAERSARAKLARNAVGGPSTGRQGLRASCPVSTRFDGCGAILQVAERSGKLWDEVRGVYEVVLSGGKGAGKTAVGGRKRRIAPKTCAAMAAMGHKVRAKLMLQMLTAPATYRTLQKATKLEAGPLYHHVNQLRLAGLVMPKQRDLYELTRGGRNLILTAMAAESLIRDTRRRPLGT